MMISTGDSGEEDRVLWVGFDSSQTLPEGTLTERQEKWIKRDIDLMEDFVGAMAKDHEEDRLNLAYSCYYGY
ncbi:hypothetical protein SI65_04237 [Aspergillus cristatus]|uniref:Uncharacterized protein n=1 Tax=Aspergillus cristatus TaxID=573508 RepID=A0A1E3BJQ7_ASPCR|nr:hypothetical protein SI65_04237 [Aspergillus cristatus]